MQPTAPTADPRHKWKPCPRCGQPDWFYGTKTSCLGCKAEERNTPAAIQKRRAQRAVVTAVRTGKLVRQPCVRCTQNGSAQRSKSHGHHEDYSKPLEVVWLCSLHHTWVHNSRRGEVFTSAQGATP